MNCCSPQDETSAEGKQPRMRPSITGFGADEAMAFWTGMHDQPRTLQVSLLASWVEDLFGIQPKPRIADPRLESIRRVTVALRHGLARQAGLEIDRARQHGVGERELAALRYRLRVPAPHSQAAA